jgi:cytochrome b561
LANAHPGGGVAAIGRDGAGATAMRYAPTAQWLHWITALLVLATVPIAWVMATMPHGAPPREGYFALHKSLGVTILLLTAARLAWRARHHAPPPPPGVPRWSVLAARANHALLYAVLLGMPVSGYIESASDGHPVHFFGLFDLPLLPPDEALAHTMLAVHLTLQWLLYALLVLHILGTAWHIVLRRDGTLERMLPPQTGVP